MNQLPGYQLNERLHAGQRFVTWRGTRAADARNVVVKMSATRPAQLRDTASLRHEYEMSRLLDVPNVIRALSIEEAPGGGPALVMEDFGGISLHLHRQQQPRLDLASFCKVAIRIAEALVHVHNVGVVHKDIKPSNLIIHPRSLDVRLTDFGIASRLSRESSAGRNPERLEGTLAYMSPEQTGRMNRGVDSRSDLYSFGATCYELLTGRPPFDAVDPLELVYCHLARQPVPPHALDSSIPPALSALVMKLLAKMAEERYQTALGVKVDLERCLATLESGGTLSEFPLGERDVPREFQIPQKLYGRQEQVHALLEAFGRVAAGAKELLLVSGPAGTGKSALVGEVNRPIAGRRGYFISGKFDQFRQDIPYSALIHAVQALTRRLLSESAERVAAWRERLLSTLAPNAQVLIDVVPEVELLLGRQPPAVPLGPSESEIRFNRTMRQFVNTLATAEHPLVLFLDDLQWADTASLKLLRLLLTDAGLSHLLVLGAYRDNEVDETHPLTELLAGLRRQGTPASSVALGALELEHVTELVADTLHAPPDAASPLAELVLSKTGGNAFFVGQFLTTLYRKHLLDFHPSEGRWVWDLERIRSENITDNVGELLSNRLGTLAPDTRRAVQLAAFIGSTFDLRTLALAAERSPEQVAASLEEALRAELILPLGEAYKYSELVRTGTTDGTEPGIAYAFMHDRVQQAAYHSIPEDERPALHRRIGRLLLKGGLGERDDEQLFEIVAHLNAALLLVEDVAERYRLAEMNLRAGRKAKRSTAYDPALRLLDTGCVLLPPGAWESHRALAFELHMELAETAYLAGNLRDMQRLVDTLWGKPLTVRERVRLLELQLNYNNSIMEWGRCISLGLQALNMLGERFPARPGKPDVVLALARTKLALRGLDTDALRALPEMTDVDKLATMRILRLTASAAYFSLPDLFPLITFRLVQLSIRYGNTGLSAYGYVLYGLILCAVLGDYDGGYAFGRLGMEVMERFRARELTATLTMIFNVFIRHWKEPLAPSVQDLLQAAPVGLETGDLEYFSYDHYFTGVHGLLTGEELDLLRARVDRSHATVYRQKQEKGHLVLLHLRHLIDSLQLPSLVRPRLEGDCTEEYITERWRKAGDHNALCYAYGFQAVARFFQGDHQGSLKRFALCDQHAAGLLGQSLQPFYAFYQTLSLLAVVPGQRNGERRASLRRVAAHLRRFRKWARHSPVNYAHKLHLLEAERARVLGKSADVVQHHYARSIFLAHEHGVLQDEALAHELVARYLLARSLKTAAGAHLSEARRLYLRWGATARAAALQKEHPELLGLAPVSLRASTRELTTTSSGATTSEALDLEWLMRATQAISGEIVLDGLVRHLMRFTMESAGAQRGVLLLERGGFLTFAAEATHGEKNVTLLEARLLEGSERLSSNIAHYCFRTREHLVLEDATKDARFANDAYVASARPRSVLCSPIVHQGKVEGVIYLENNLTTGAFTPARLETVQLLSSQAGVSIRNAVLYEELRKSLEAQVELTTAHSRFVPHQFLHSLNRRNIVDVQLGDHVQKEISILFSDIRGFTSISESLPPGELLRFINHYLSYIEPVLLESGGFIDSYSGDGVMALFDGSADMALRGAIAMHRALDGFNAERREKGEKPVRTGIGINTGPVMMGTIGGKNQLKCSVIGDAVNLASRVEGLTKVYGASLLITEHTYRGLEDPSRYSLRRIERVRVLGKQEPVTLYEVLDAEPREVREEKERHRERFLAAQDRYYARNFVGALALLGECLADCPTDKAVALFVERCQRYIRETVPPDWDGVERLTHK